MDIKGRNFIIKKPSACSPVLDLMPSRNPASTPVVSVVVVLAKLHRVLAMRSVGP